MIKQRTIKNTVAIEGVGLQTGNKVKLTLRGSSPDSGINFVRTDISGSPSLNLAALDIGHNSRDRGERRTTLGLGESQIQTTEHLLAAFCGLGIDNITVEMDNSELPGADGSSKVFLDAIKSAIVVEQELPKKTIDLKDPVWCKSGDSVLAIFPDDNFRISYTLSYPGIGVQFFSAILDEKTFTEEVASARTFCSEMEAMELLKRGLGKGANYENTLVMGPKGPVSNTLRFADEPVRHKVLDLIGDLYLLGASVRGHVVAVKSGHKLNMELVKKIRMNSSASPFSS